MERRSFLQLLGLSPVLTVRIAAPSSLAYSNRYRPLLDGFEVWPCKFGKHAIWVPGPKGSGDWYCFGGDGGTVDHPDSGGSVGYLKWNPSNPLLLKYFYPYHGRAGEVWPYRPDCHNFVRMSNGHYRNIPGYSGALPVPQSPKDLGTPLKVSDYFFDYDPFVATNNWKVICPSSQVDALKWIGQSERNSAFSFDDENDLYFGITAGSSIYTIDLRKLDTSPQTASTYATINGAGAAAGAHERAHQVVWIKETNELVWHQTDNNSPDVTRPMRLYASHTKTGATRLLWQSTKALYSAFETGAAGELPMVIASDRRKIYLFWPEFRDRGGFYLGQPPREPGSHGPDGKGLLDTGIQEIAFGPGWKNPVHTEIPYPQECKNYAAVQPGNTAHDTCFFNAFYDAERGKIYAPFNNYNDIFEFKLL